MKHGASAPPTQLAFVRSLTRALAADRDAKSETGCGMHLEEDDLHCLTSWWFQPI